MMKKISYIVLILILLILIVNMFSSNKSIVHKKKKIEQKEGLIEKVKITPNIKIKLVEKKEDNKTKKKEVKEENVKYCLEKSEYSYGKTVNYTYENGLLIKIEKNYNGNRDSIILEYNGKDKVESKQLEFINYSTENVLNAIVNYTYDDDYDFSHKKLSKEDFEYLFVDFSLSIICPNDNIDMRYHEEFDDNGRLISANIMQKNTLLLMLRKKEKMLKYEV